MRWRCVGIAVEVGDIEADRKDKKVRTLLS